MKKKLIIIVAASLLIIGGIAFYLYKSIFGGENLGKYIPENAMFALKVDLIGMGKKIKTDELREMKFFKEEFMGNLPREKKELVEKILKNPLESGLSVGSAPILFGFNTSKKSVEPVIGLVFGVKDSKKLSKLIEVMSDDEISIKSPDADGFYSAEMDRGDNAVLYYNEKVGFILTDPDNNDISLKKIRNQLVDLKKEESLLGDKKYANKSNESNDIMLYINGSSLKDLALLTDIGDENEELEEAIKKGVFNQIPYAMTLEFKEDDVCFRSYMEDGSSNESMVMQNTGLSDQDLAYMAPNGAPLAFAALNINIKNMLKIISGLKEADEFFDGVDGLAELLSVSKDDILEMLDGKISASITKINTAITPMPVFVVRAGLAKTKVPELFLQKVKGEGSFVEEDGIYYESNEFDEPKFFIAMLNKNFFVSNDKKTLRQLLDKKSWKTLTEEKGKKIATENPFSLFADLQYKNYENTLKESLGSRETIEIDKFKGVLNNFNNLSGYGNNKEVGLDLKMSKENINSLWRMIVMVDKTYNILN